MALRPAGIFGPERVPGVRGSRRPLARVGLPDDGKVQIAQVLAGAGLRLGATTVGRMLKEGGPLDEADDEAVADDGGSEVTTRVVTAKHPDPVWHLDSSAIPTSPGFWIPWTPLSCQRRHSALLVTSSRH